MPDNEVIQKGELPTEEELFYKEIGQTWMKENIPFLNECLRNMVTLGTALLGGSIVFLDKEKMHQGFQGTVIVLFLIGLAFALLGMLPYGGHLSWMMVYDVRDEYEQTRKFKTNWLRGSAILIMLGFVAALAGLIARWCNLC